MSNLWDEIEIDPTTQRPVLKHATGRVDPLVIVNPGSNPCVSVYGAGPDGATCATCAHLHVIHYSRRVYKCGERPLTGGAGTDHRKGWPACRLYSVVSPATHTPSH